MHDNYSVHTGDEGGAYIHTCQLWDIWRLNRCKYIFELPSQPNRGHAPLMSRVIADDGTVKIGGFGQSKYKDLKDVYFDTEVPGAFLFMAPETTKPSGSDKAQYTESVDIFSLGVLALEIATQSYPTPSLHGFGVLPEVKRRESDLKKMGDGHPLKPLVLKCLEDNYKKRPVITQIVDNLVV